ncbi:MAG: DUF1801 domain-containing protein [Chitinophagales bacterium]|nr:DUF1801 domain-containing protein [Chitinophagales bacterium]
MTVKAQIKAYLESHSEPKGSDLLLLHSLILKERPKCKLWFLDGKDSKGKIVSNPNIGYGSYTITYADGSTKEFFQIGLSANTTGISVYIMGLEDKTYLPKTYAKKIGKATVTGYCIKFRKVEDIDLGVLREVVTITK